MSEAQVFDVNPAVRVKSESPLAASRVRVAALPSVAGAGIVVREFAMRGHLILRGNASDEAFVTGVEKALSLPLPRKSGGLALDASGQSSIQWMSPDEWLIIVPGGSEFATEVKLRECLSGHFAVINVSGGQTVLELRGTAVRQVLMKSTPYDVHPDHFPVGKGVGTVFAKSTALVRRVAEDRWELVIRRSFADYLFTWLLDAAEEFGVHVVE